MHDVCFGEASNLGPPKSRVRPHSMDEVANSAVASLVERDHENK